MKQFLCFDWGRKHIGVAAGNDVIQTAQGIAVIEGDLQSDVGTAWAEIEALVATWRPAALVVGIPYHPDGAAHRNTRHALDFAQALQARTGLTVHPIDERYSTTDARRAMGLTDNLGSQKRAQKRLSQLDAQAACVILQQFLNPL